MLTETQVSRGVTQFLSCLEQADTQSYPFAHWLLSDILPIAWLYALAALPFAPPDGAVFNGQRESNNALRVYFTQQIQNEFATCRDIVEVFNDPAVLQKLQKLTGTDVSAGQLRIEYCQDVDGFWLEPHRDISVKLFTMLIYVSDDPQLFDAGTDIYDDTPEHRLVASVPYEKNRGLIFIPGTNSWHGFSKRPINGLRKSLIINYVSPDWRAAEELSFPKGEA
ncbi:MAG: 2OG-Fe(II) oxygenase [Acidocella sp.]|nr:2OG-Fe(II) oxygenase [Acidocella sp.]